MGQICESCGKGELKDLVPGIRQCSVCRKIFKGEVKIEETKTVEGELLEGQVFMDETTLNPKWEIADKGITIEREKNKSWLAVLLCHPPDFPNKNYVRISWWKKSINEHAGMFKIEDHAELENTILALERIDKNFNDNFDPVGDVNDTPLPARAKFDEVTEFDEKKKLCLSCKSKMKLSKNHRYYECDRCGDIVVVLDGKPIINWDTDKLPLGFSSNYPVNFYLPNYGITVKMLMADWKAIVIIYAKENPEKKWLRFYWWQRDLQNYMMSEYSMGVSQALKWDAKKGTLSPNLYDKKSLRLMIAALKKMKTLWKEEKQ